MGEFNKKKLSNGLTILHEKRDVPVTTIMLAVKFGAAYEKEEEKGMAHFIEHLCFKGTEKRDVRQIAEDVEGVGGDINAFTNEEITAYYAKLPSKYLNKAEVIFDIFFNPTFPEEDVKREAQVICEEIKMYRDNPRSHGVEMIKSHLYENPFGMFVGGSQESVKSMTREQLLKKHRDVYVPSNSVLCVVGNNDFEEVVSMAEKFVVEREGDLPEIPEIKLKNGESEEKRKDIQQSNLTIGFHFPFASDEKDYAADIFSTILGRGMSSRLFTEVREKRGLVYGVKTESDTGKNYGYMVIWAGTDPSKVDEVKKVCLTEFEKMKDLTLEEFEEGKKKAIGGYYLARETSEQTALNLILNEFYKKAEDFYDYEKRINEVKIEDIKDLAKKKDSSFFVVGP